MNIMTGYLSANAGTVRIGGKDILEEPGEAKKRIGFLPETPPLYGDMRVEMCIRDSSKRLWRSRLAGRITGKP